MTITYEELIKMSYQTIKNVLKKMDDQTVQSFMNQTEKRLNMFSDKVDQPCTPTVFDAVLGGMKKLEIVYGFLFDRINGTDFQTFY